MLSNLSFEPKDNFQERPFFNLPFLKTPPPLKNLNLWNPLTQTKPKLNKPKNLIATSKSKSKPPRTSNAKDFENPSSSSC